jgi:valyl-tRNA synthetase
MNEKFLKPYTAADTEERIYKKWEESGYFNPDNLSDLWVTDTKSKPRTEAFTIVMPPPNANGSLHVGHALAITLEDLMIRFKRMQGYKALWIPGADHAGFETQVVYEKKLEKEGRSRFGMDPKELYSEILSFTLENKKNMENQVRALGASCDWSRERFTLDPDIIEEVQKTFIKMFTDGLVYRGKRTVNWCSKHQTSLSDVETENTEEKTPFYYFKYGPFEIGTVRPETKFGDKYVVMHPEDARYAEYTHGQEIELEWINGPITATIIKDEAVEMDFGTGVMTITPAHSQIDFEIAMRHSLDIEQIIDTRGKLLKVAQEFEGMKIAEAREKIVQKLESKGLLTRTDTEYKNIVKRCYKCNTLIEPQIKDQWFIKMAPLAKLALDAVTAHEVTFVPDHEEKVFRYWMENALDWNISRQIVWGIQIPAWKKIIDSKEQWVASIEKPEGEGWEMDSDTFDTWFSSGQWPLLTTGYPKGKDFETYYPTSVMETGRDLIFKWIPRMIIFGLYLGKKSPFKTVYLHGLVNDAKGKKMSKSVGNVISPGDLSVKYGTDALRMSLLVGNTPGTDLALLEDKVKGYRNFANKIWNITRFILENKKEEYVTYSFSKQDLLLVEEFTTLAKDITNDLENYRIYMAAEKLYHYVWHRFADEILEDSKTIFSLHDEAAKDSRRTFLEQTHRSILVLLHPFMPFITEEIWQMIRTQEDVDMLIIAPWPVVE